MTDAPPVLYYDDVHPEARSCLMLIHMLNLEVSLHYVALFEGGLFNPDYMTLNPVHTVPTLVDKNVTLTDGHAIMMYLCDTHPSEMSLRLFPRSFEKRISVINMLFFESSIIFRRYSEFMSEIVRKTYAGTDVDYHEKKILDIYDMLESFLQENKFVAGPKLTIADLSIFSTLSALDLIVPIGKDNTRWPLLLQWVQQLNTMPECHLNTVGLGRQREIIEKLGQFQFPMKPNVTEESCPWPNTDHCGGTNNEINMQPPHISSQDDCCMDMSPPPPPNDVDLMVDIPDDCCCDAPPPPPDPEEISRCSCPSGNEYGENAEQQIDSDMNPPPPIVESPTLAVADIVKKFEQTITEERIRTSNENMQDTDCGCGHEETVANDCECGEETSNGNHNGIMYLSKSVQTLPPEELKLSNKLRKSATGIKGAAKKLDPKVKGKGFKLESSGSRSDATTSVESRELRLSVTRTRRLSAAATASRTPSKRRTTK